MTQDSQDRFWGPWIAHDHSGCPVRPGVVVMVLDCVGDVMTGEIPDYPGRDVHWLGPRCPCRGCGRWVNHYRFRRSPAFHQLLDKAQDTDHPDLDGDLVERPSEVAL